MSRSRVKWIGFAITFAVSVSICTVGLSSSKTAQYTRATVVDAVVQPLSLHGYVFSDDGNYVTLDVNSYKIVGQVSLWKEVLELAKYDQKFQPFAYSRPLRVIGDPKEGRAFVLVGVEKSEVMMGYLILSLEKATPVGAIRQEMRLSSAGLAINAPRHKIYLSYLSPKEDQEGKSSLVTVIYDSQNLREIRRYQNSDLRIQAWSCFSDNGAELYTNQRVFDTTTDAEVRKLAFSGKPFLPVACQKGLILLLSKAEDGSTVLSIYDTRSHETVRQIKTAIPFRADVDAWALSRDGQVVVFDERRLVPVGQGQALEKTGRLQFFNATTGLKAGELQLKEAGGEDSGILDLSFDGSELFYRSGTRLFVVSLSAMSVTAEISLPFRPVGVVWF